MASGFEACGRARDENLGHRARDHQYGAERGFIVVFAQGNSDRHRVCSLDLDRCRRDLCNRRVLLWRSQYAHPLGGCGVDYSWCDFAQAGVSRLQSRGQQKIAMNNPQCAPEGVLL